MKLLAIDPGSHKTGVAVLDEDGLRWWLLTAKANVDPFLRLTEILGKLDAICQDEGYIDCVAVENTPFIPGRPGQEIVYLSSGMMSGYIMGAGYSNKVLLVRPAKWKKAITGKGNSQKDETRKHLVASLPHGELLQDAPEDAVDACGIVTWLSREGV